MRRSIQILRTAVLGLTTAAWFATVTPADDLNAALSRAYAEGSGIIAETAPKAPIADGLLAATSDQIDAAPARDPSQPVLTLPWAAKTDETSARQVVAPSTVTDAPEQTSPSTVGSAIGWDLPVSGDAEVLTANSGGEAESPPWWEAGLAWDDPWLDLTLDIPPLPDQTPDSPEIPTFDLAFADDGDPLDGWTILGRDPTLLDLLRIQQALTVLMADEPEPWPDDEDDDFAHSRYLCSIPLGYDTWSRHWSTSWPLTYTCTTYGSTWPAGPLWYDAGWPWVIHRRPPVLRVCTTYPSLLLHGWHYVDGRPVPALVPHFRHGWPHRSHRRPWRDSGWSVGGGGLTVSLRIEGDWGYIALNDRSPVYRRHPCLRPSDAHPRKDTFHLKHPGGVSPHRPRHDSDRRDWITYRLADGGSVSFPRGSLPTAPPALGGTNAEQNPRGVYRLPVLRSNQFSQPQIRHVFPPVASGLPIPQITAGCNDSSSVSPQAPSGLNFLYPGSPLRLSRR